MKRLTITALAAALFLAACSEPAETAESVALSQETMQADRVAERFNNSQPVPEFEWSQQRQNLIELLTAQARTTATTTFFFNLGIQDPIAQCPSIGFPIPATYQLTNPERGVRVDVGARDAQNPAVDVAQLEATGVYTADTSGTYAICVGADGEAYAQYWEGFVSTVTGAADWVDGEVQLIGPSSFDFSEGQ